MKKFEYVKVGGFKLTKSSSSIMVDILNEYGQDGWELVTFTWVDKKLAFAYFKREII